MRNFTVPFTTSSFATAAIAFMAMVSSPFLAAKNTSAEMHHDHAATSIAANSKTAEQYTSRGTIKSWGEKKVSLAHPAIPELNWPPMTMSFDLPEKFSGKPLTKGTEVMFSFRQIEHGYQLITIAPQQP